MMATKAVRLELRADFLAAWHLLEEVMEDDFANVRVVRLCLNKGRCPANRAPARTFASV
jgi:hypothetical protein